MMTGYNLTNIRNLLTEGFTDEALRCLCYDVLDFKPVYDQLTPNSDKDQLVNWLLGYAK